MNLSQDELLSQLQGMDEYEFEELVADVWKQKGWDTTVTTGSSDRGIDVIAKKSTPFSQKQLIQAKRYSAGNKVGSPDIQQYSSLRHQEDDVDAVVVVTTSSFSSQASQTANDLNVKLIDGNDLCEMTLDLRSQEFLSDYLSRNTHSTGGVEKSRQKTGTTEKDANTARTKDETGYYEIPPDDGDELPDNFQKDEKITKLGKFCPMCGDKNSIWEGETPNKNPLLACEECGTRWTKKTGIIASTKWKIVGGNEKKTASAWKETIDMDSTADTENNSVSEERAILDNIAASESPDVPDEYERGKGPTRTFGAYCPMCGGREKIYFYKNGNHRDQMLICRECETQWVMEQKSEKTGSLSSNKWTKWKVVGEDISKKASEWEEIYH